MTMMFFLEMGFQKALPSTDATLRACCRVTLTRSILIFLSWNSGSKITFTPASFPTVLKIVRESELIFMEIGSLESEINAGGVSIKPSSGTIAMGGGWFGAARLFSWG